MHGRGLGERHGEGLHAVSALEGRRDDRRAADRRRQPVRIVTGGVDHEAIGPEVDICARGDARGPGPGRMSAPRPIEKPMLDVLGRKAPVRPEARDPAHFGRQADAGAEHSDQDVGPGARAVGRDEHDHARWRPWGWSSRSLGLAGLRRCDAAQPARAHLRLAPRSGHSLARSSHIESRRQRAGPIRRILSFSLSPIIMDSVMPPSQVPSQ